MDLFCLGAIRLGGGLEQRILRDDLGPAEQKQRAFFGSHLFDLNPLGHPARGLSAGGQEHVAFTIRGNEGRIS
jgi:hypothetical protein